MVIADDMASPVVVWWVHIVVNESISTVISLSVVVVIADDLASPVVVGCVHGM